MKETKGLIKLNKELNAVIDFIKLKWKTDDALEVMLRKAWDKGIILYKNQSLRSCSKKYKDYISNPDLFNEFIYNDKYKETLSYYHPYKIFMRKFLEIGDNTIFDERGLDFSFDDINKYVNSILKENPSYKKMKPLAIESYEESKEAKDFKGTKVITPPSSLDFPYDIYIAGDHKNIKDYTNKEKVIHLLMAVIRHSSSCQKHNNDIILNKEIEKVDLYFKNFGKEICFDLSFENVTKNRFLLKVLNESKKEFLSEEDFKNKKLSIDKYELIPICEKNRENVKNDLSSLWDEVLNETFN